MTREVQVIDTGYNGNNFCAAFLMVEKDAATIVETNTNFAVPRILDALAAAGRTPEQVEYIIVTHVHLDHAGGAAALMERCANATLLAHERAAPHLIDPSKLVNSATAVYGGPEAFHRLYGDIGPIDAARVRVMKDEETLSFGQRTLRFLYTRGHANHHFCIHDDRSNGIFTGDAFGLRYPQLQAHGLLAFPTTTPTDFDGPAYRDTLRRIVDTGCDQVFLTHYGAYSDVAAMAEVVDRQLCEYSALVDEADEMVNEDSDLDSFCAERVSAIFAQELRSCGLEGDDDVRRLLALDVDLNAQGVAFAVKKRRFKRAKAQA
ncbi:MAG: MBL fold metallo-hydrolase [Myxococcota bacterium]